MTAGTNEEHVRVNDYSSVTIIITIITVGIHHHRFLAAAQGLNTECFLRYATFDGTTILMKSSQHLQNLSNVRLVLIFAVYCLSQLIIKLMLTMQ